MTSITRKLPFCIALVFLIALSLAILALEITSKNFVEYSQTNGFTIYPDPAKDDNRTVHSLPMHLFMNGSEFTLAVSVLSLVTGIAALLFSLWLWRNGTKA